MKLRVLHIVGARPNLMKIAPLVSEMAKYPGDFRQHLVHTGQHYDANMSRIFFEELGLPEPNIHLGVGSGAHGEQTARVMIALEPILMQERPDLVIVVGDVNSTLAAALTAVKLHIPVAHVEAGLRSGDRAMPEEINRILTDQIADLLFTPSRDADQNLRREGIPDSKVFFVGNVMIDTLVRLLSEAENRPVLEELGLRGDDGAAVPYVLVELHRPSNVDDRETLRELIEALLEIAERIPVVFSVHPRTRTRIQRGDLAALLRGHKGLHPIDPVGYLDFLCLQRHAAAVLTDSGGIQEETTYLGIPCVTARPSTERPVTIAQGTNRLVASRREAIVEAVFDAWRDPPTDPRVPELWDGHAAERIVAMVRRVKEKGKRKKEKGTPGKRKGWSASVGLRGTRA